MIFHHTNEQTFDDLNEQTFNEISTEELRKLQKTIKIVLYAKIIGDTLSIASNKVKPVILNPYKVDGVRVDNVKNGMIKMCNVEIHKNKITKIISFG